MVLGLDREFSRAAGVAAVEPRGEYNPAAVVLASLAVRLSAIEPPIPLGPACGLVEMFVGLRRHRSTPLRRISRINDVRSS